MKAQLLTLVLVGLLPLASHAKVEGAFPLYRGFCQAEIESKLSAAFKNCESCASIENTLAVKGDVFTIFFYVMRPHEPVLETRAEVTLKVRQEAISTEPGDSRSYREIADCEVLNVSFF